MAFSTFDAFVVVDPRTLAPIAGVAGTITDATTGNPVQVYDMTGNPVPVLATNYRGYVGDFQAPGGVRMIEATFGTVRLRRHSLEAIAEAGLLSARVLAEESATTDHGRRLNDLEVLGGLAPGDVSDATVASLLGNGSSATTAAALDLAELRGRLEVAAHAYADFESGLSSQYGAKVQGQYVTDSTDGQVRPVISSLLSDRVPFVESPDPGQPPVGWERHGAFSIFAGLETTPEKFTWHTGTNSSSTTILGGIRTDDFLLQPGTDYAVSMGSEITNETTILQKMRLGVQRADGFTFVFGPSWHYATEPYSRGYRRFTTPAGTDQWKFVVFGYPLDQVEGIEADLTIGTPLIYPAPNLPSGYDFFGKAVEERATAKTVVIRGLDPSALYLLMLRTTQAGLVTIYTTSSVAGEIDLLDVFPGGTLDVLEAWAVPPSEYREGMATAASQAWRFESVRTIDGADRQHTQPESQEIVARSVGLMRNLAHPENPDGPRSIQHDIARMHHTRFVTVPGESYIGDRQGGNSSQRAEIGTGVGAVFNTPLWANFGVIFRQPVTGPVAMDPINIFWQTRYVPDPGESSGFSPEISLMQRPDGVMRLQMISDNGVYQDEGSAGAPNLPPDHTFTTFDWAYELNTYYHVWMAFEVSDSGGGRMHLKINGQTIYDQAVPIGYNRQSPPNVRFGSYKYSETGADTEIFGSPLPTTQDLTGFDVLPVPGR